LIAFGARAPGKESDRC